MFDPPSLKTYACPSARLLSVHCPGKSDVIVQLFVPPLLKVDTAQGPVDGGIIVKLG